MSYKQLGWDPDVIEPGDYACPPMPVVNAVWHAVWKWAPNVAGTKFSWVWVGWGWGMYGLCQRIRDIEWSAPLGKAPQMWVFANENGNGRKVVFAPLSDIADRCKCVLV